MICENIEKFINMKNTPIDYDIVNETIDEMSIPDFGKATIREVVAIASRLEEKTGQEFIHMEMGVPGLPPAAVGVEAEIEALRNGVASIYPVIDGLPRLKKEAARFVKAFIDVDVDPRRLCPGSRFYAGYIYIVFSGRSNAIRKKTRFFLSIPVSLYKNNK